MNNKDFTYILQHPEAVLDSQTPEMKSIIDQFPYFQTVRALYLKGLKTQESFKYNQELKTTAAYTTDRSILFDFITSDVFTQNEISKFIKTNSDHLNDIDVIIEDLSINKKTSIDEISPQDIKNPLESLNPSRFKSKFEHSRISSTENVTSETKTQETSSEDVLNLGKPLEFSKKEKHSFNEWLKLSSFKTIKRDQKLLKISSETENSSQIERDKKFQLIDEFISKNPKINPTKSLTQKGNIAKAQLIETEELMTETLARIYVEQKNYKKAIQSYKILSLKYPEKSSFFAVQIEAVKQIQEQNNKE